MLPWASIMPGFSKPFLPYDKVHVFSVSSDPDLILVFYLAIAKSPTVSMEFPAFSAILGPVASVQFALLA